VDSKLKISITGSFDWVSGGFGLGCFRVGPGGSLKDSGLWRPEVPTGLTQPDWPLGITVVSSLPLYIDFFLASPLLKIAG